MKKLTFGLCLSASLLAGSASAAIFEIAPVHTDIAFVIKHLSISKVTGRFNKYTAEIDYDPASATFKTLKAQIDTDSINTNNETRDAVLTSDQFLGAEKNPKITFEMTKYEKISDTEGKVYGNLQIAGVSKAVVLNAEINGTAKNQDGKEVLGFSLEGKINRKDFHIADAMPSAALSNETKLTIDVEAVAK